MNTRRSRPSSSIPTGDEAPSKPVCLTARRKAWIEPECGLDGRRTCEPTRTTRPAFAIPPSSCCSATPPPRVEPVCITIVMYNANRGTETESGTKARAAPSCGRRVGPQRLGRGIAAPVGRGTRSQHLHAVVSLRVQGAAAGGGAGARRGGAAATCGGLDRRVRLGDGRRCGDRAVLGVGVASGESRAGEVGIRGPHVAARRGAAPGGTSSPADERVGGADRW